MTPGTFKDHILEAYRDGRRKELEDIVLGGLESFRESAIEDLETLMFDVDAKLRDTFFQLMVKDNGADMIPRLISIIRKEKNPLYFKNHLLHFSNLHHPEAIDALEALEQGLPTEARMQWQRSLGKLKANFREYNYMREFKRGGSNPKRIKQAAEMMIKAPHPDYIPFLNEMLAADDAGVAREAVRVLQKLGNQSSYEPLSLLFRKLAVDRMHADVFLDMPFFKEHVEQFDLSKLIDVIDVAIDTGWDEADRMDLMDEYLSGNHDAAIVNLLIPFGFRDGSLYQRAKESLEDLCNADKKLDDVARGKLRQAVHTRIEHLIERLHEIVLAMSHINRQSESEAFVSQLEEMMPPDLPERETLIFSALAGLKSQSAKQHLLDYMNSSPAAMTKVLDALNTFVLDDVPETVIDLAGDPKNGPVRQRAIELIANSPNGPAHLRPLLEHESVVVRADAVKAIAEHQVEPCYKDLLDLLHLDNQVSFLLVILEALESFDDERTAQAVQRFMTMPRPLKVRAQTLRTIIKAGGANRYSMITDVLRDYPGRHFSEMFEAFVEEIQEVPRSKDVSSFLALQDFWELCLNHDQAAVRKATVKLLDKVAWEEHGIAEWVAIFQQALHTHTDDRNKEELELLRRSLLRINVRLEEIHKSETMRQRFNEILERLQQDSQFEKLQALRELEQAYQREMLEDNPDALLPLILELREFLDRHENAHKMEILAINVAGKIGLPALKGKIESYLKHPNMAVSQAARNALQLPLNEKLRVSLIKSILVMDDSHYITELVARILQTKGYQVAQENKPMLGLQRLSSHKFDLLILDLKMPELSGAEFLQNAVHQKVKPRFTMILTGNRNREELLEVSQFGVDTIVLKPFHAKDILARVRAIEEKWMMG
ncbi:Response regulator transcription factor [Sulfidibacter corallicola]|uniref:Response regulator transcription factor n=1 Tax=Sulfidibacter corallicola TaxID=2818388 RepID=A0A8A4TR58_SULCO|nr:response regulator [Sulfidibacter corallicola]QTD51887.1 response regulator transcription factor [Sulfidibacter corallicola]